MRQTLYFPKKLRNKFQPYRYINYMRKALLKEFLDSVI